VRVPGLEPGMPRWATVLQTAERPPLTTHKRVTNGLRTRDLRSHNPAL
jgi:hypothetical protein